MIQRIERGSKKAYDSLFAALQMKETIQEVVSVIGGGGKTTLIRRLQQEGMTRGIYHHPYAVCTKRSLSGGRSSGKVVSCGEKRAYGLDGAACVGNENEGLFP